MEHHGNTFFRDSPGEMKSGINSREKNQDCKQKCPEHLPHEAKIYHGQELTREVSAQKIPHNSRTHVLIPKCWMETSPKSN